MKSPAAPVFSPSPSAPDLSPRHLPLHLDRSTLRTLLQLQGPSLGLWRAAEVAALREQVYEPPVLDLGCGDGLVTSLVLPEVEYGVDPDPVALEKAAVQGIYTHRIVAAIEQAAITTESISTIVSNSVLEHIADIEPVLSAIANLLKPGGKLVFTVPTESFSQWLAIPLAYYSAQRNQQLCHLNLWSSDRWSYHLTKAGFTVETVRPYLQRHWVSLWDTLELLQQVKLGDRRLFGRVWRRLPPDWMDWFAELASQLDFSTPEPGGGQLIVARKGGGGDGDR